MPKNALTVRINQSRAGTALTGGGNPAPVNPPPTAHDILSLSHSDTVPAALAIGDILVASGLPPKLERYGLVVPSAGILNYLGIVYGETVPSYKSASSDPGAAAAILASDANGYLTLVRLTATGIFMADGGTIGQPAGPLIAFNDTFNTLLFTGAVVGIGITGTPAAHLEVIGDATPALYLSQYSDNNTSAGFRGRKARGTLASPTQVLANDGIALFSAYGYHSGGGWSSTAPGIIGFYAAEDFTATKQGVYGIISTTPKGATSRVERMRITDGGTIQGTRFSGDATDTKLKREQLNLPYGEFPRITVSAKAPNNPRIGDFWLDIS